MRSSYPISLFSGPPPRDNGPSGYVVSVVVHSIFFSLLFLSMRHVSVREKSLWNGPYNVRLLDMRRSEESRWYPRQKNASQQSRAAARHGVHAGGKLGASAIPKVARTSRNFETDKPAPHTMIQPEVPQDQKLLDIQVPKAMVWTAGEIKQTKIVTPPPQPAGEIHVKPSLKIPNHELNPSDVPLSSTQFIAEKSPLPAPSTTVPVQVDGAAKTNQIPLTTSQDTTMLSPARAISVSDLKLDEGTAALPVVHEIAEADTSGAPVAGQDGGVTVTGQDATDSESSGEGAGNGAGEAGDDASGYTVNAGSNAGSEDAINIDTGAGNGPDSGTSAKHITLPKGGRYGMVVVGASPEENYPQTAHLWTGRMVYTVYLQTDTPQNWILQFSLLRNVGDDPPNGSRPDAPWPYDMMRPNLGSYKNVILVHGFVNTAGRFEQLSVAYPPRFSQAELLLRALKKWEFRPAMSEGQAATVEVLLIIPGEMAE